MRNYAAQSDPARNPHFSRRWAEPPRADNFKSIGQVTDKVVDDTAKRAIAHWLQQAAALDGEEAQAALEVADSIRAMMACSWDELMGLGRAA
jgi:hypothetical protein